MELKTKEMNRVKRLAKNILDQVCIFVYFSLQKYKQLIIYKLEHIMSKLETVFELESFTFQRSEIEHFFLDSLECVKNEIAKNRYSA